jgi:CDP-paratose 2-epimerase
MSELLHKRVEPVKDRNHKDRNGRGPKDRSVLIFGGAGFIGSNLAHYLLTRTSACVHVFDSLVRNGVQHNLEWLKEVAANSNRLRITIADVRDRVLVERAVADATEIYHFAAQVAVTTSILDPRLDFEVNLGGTFNILDAVRRAGHKPFMLFTSTNKVYGDLGLGKPTRQAGRYVYPGHNGVSESQPLDFHSPYGCSKGGADQYVHDFGRIYGIPTVVLRMSCIAGPRQFGTEDQGWVAHFLYSALQQRPIVIYGDGRQVRDVLAVQDLIRAMDLLRGSQETSAGQIYNVGGGVQNTTSLLELIAHIEKLTGQKLEITSAEPRPGDQLVYVTDFTKLRLATGWSPEISVQQTLRLLKAFWEQNHQVLSGMSAALPSLEIAAEPSGSVA